MDDSPRNPKKSWIGCLAIPLGCLAVLILVCGGGMLYLSISSSPRMVFESETGLRWPSNAAIVSTGANHDGFHGDGEFHLVLDLDQSEIDHLLATQPRSPMSQWQSGPVPTEIGFHCSFGTEGVIALSFDGGKTKYSGDEELENLLGSSAIVYSALERCCDSLRWHNGTLLVVDPKNRRVWLSIWDF